MISERLQKLIEDMVEKGDMPWNRKVTAEKKRRSMVLAAS